MTQSRFLCDYGTLPTEFLNIATVSNATELLWSKDLERLLRLCGIPEREIDARASDYERFAALCKAFALLDGHPMQFYLKSFLRAYFPSLPMPEPETCECLWRGIADNLLANPRTPSDFLPTAPIGILLPSLEIPALPPQLTPVLDADLLLRSQGRAYGEWRAWIAETVERFSQNGARQVRVRLARDFSFAQPNVYHVEQALKKTTDAHDLLLCQLVRELCEVCARCSVALLLEADCDAREAASLLRYARKAVGLPRVNWCASGAADELLDFQADACGESMRRCLRSADALTADALYQTIADAATRYPLGCLCFVTAQDLRFSRFEQERIASALQKSF
ncbi:MAG: hypothetical protein IJW29_03965 [Clostridia bacterium]|nr:hypothetical protein [Clostridia bacterium]